MNFHGRGGLDSRCGIGCWLCKSAVQSTYPETSFTISRTKAVRLLKWPLVREIRGLDSRGVVFYFQVTVNQCCLFPLRERGNCELEFQLRP